MRRGIFSAAILVPFLLACGGDDPSGPGDDGDPDDGLVAGVGVRYMSTGGPIEVASADTTYEGDEVVLTSSGSFGTSLGSWIWDGEVIEGEATDSLVLRFEILEGTVEFEKFSGRYDATEEYSSDAWSAMEVVESTTLTVGEDVRFVLRRP